MCSRLYVRIHINYANGCEVKSVRIILVVVRSFCLFSFSNSSTQISTIIGERTCNNSEDIKDRCI